MNDEARAELVEAARLPWRPFEEAPGVDYKLLRRHEHEEGSTILIRFGPGTSYPAHRHPRGEEYFVLEGALDDGRRTYRAGDYVYYPPGSVHRPASSEGCTVLVFLPARVEPVGD